MKHPVARRSHLPILAAVFGSALLLVGCLDTDPPEPVMLGEVHRFPQDMSALSNDYQYHYSVRKSGTTTSEGRGWMRQSFTTSDASDNPYMNEIWNVREDYFPSGGGSAYDEFWSLGYNDTDDHWALLTNREGEHFANDGSGDRGVIWVHNPMSEGEIYEPQTINWPGEHDVSYSLYGRVRVVSIDTLDTAAGEVETYHFRLDASNDSSSGFTSGDVLLRYDYWLNPKLGIVRERVVLEEPTPDSDNGYTVSQYERDMESYILPSE